MTLPAVKKPRGFACLTPDQRSAIARKGGRAAHAKGTAHKFNSVEGRAAGLIGGFAVSRDSAHMSRIGAKGGRRSHGGQ